MRDYDAHLEATYGPDLDGEADGPVDQADYDRLVIDLRDDE